MNSNPPAKGADDTAASSVRIRAVPVRGLLQADDVLTWLLAGEDRFVAEYFESGARPA